MNDAERKRRILNKVAKESSGEPRWWWLSFADPHRARNDQFLGVAIVEAAGPITASLVAHDLGVNPGGEVAILPLKPEDRERLLSREEAQALLRHWAQ